MWEASIKKIEKATDDYVVAVTYSFTDGTDTIESVEHLKHPERIKRIAEDKIKELERIDSVKALLANKPIGKLDLSKPQENETEKTIREKKSELQQLKSDLDLGIISEEDYNAKLASFKELLD